MRVAAAHAELLRTVCLGRRRHAGRTAIEVQRKDHLDQLTYGRLREMAERTAAWLAMIGIGR